MSKRTLDDAQLDEINKRAIERDNLKIKILKEVKEDFANLVKDEINNRFDYLQNSLQTHINFGYVATKKEITREIKTALTNHERKIIAEIKGPKEKFPYFFQTDDIPEWDDPSKSSYPVNEDFLLDFSQHPEFPKELFYPHEDLSDPSNFQYVVKVLQATHFTKLTGKPAPYGLYRHNNDAFTPSGQLAEIPYLDQCGDELARQVNRERWVGLTEEQRRTVCELGNITVDRKFRHDVLRRWIYTSEAKVLQRSFKKIEAKYSWKLRTYNNAIDDNWEERFNEKAKNTARYHDNPAIRSNWRHYYETAKERAEAKIAEEDSAAGASNNQEH